MTYKQQQFSNVHSAELTYIKIQVLVTLYTRSILVEEVESSGWLSILYGYGSLILYVKQGIH